LLKKLLKYNILAKITKKQPFLFKKQLFFNLFCPLTPVFSKKIALKGVRAEFLKNKGLKISVLQLKSDKNR